MFEKEESMKIGSFVFGGYCGHKNVTYLQYDRHQLQPLTVESRDDI